MRVRAILFALGIAVPAATDAIWNDIRTELRSVLSPATFDLWIEPLAPAGWDGETLLLAAPDEVRSWVGWHRHITLSMFALAYLALVRKDAIGR